MEMKKKDKILVYINDEPYYQIRKDDKDGGNVWWKHVPLLDDKKKRLGLHMVNGKSSHFDTFLGKKENKDQKIPLKEHKIGGIIITNKGQYTSKYGFYIGK